MSTFLENALKQPILLQYLFQMYLALPGSSNVLAANNCCCIESTQTYTKQAFQNQQLSKTKVVKIQLFNYNVVPYCFLSSNFINQQLFHYQITTTTTNIAALQQWTPCIPIRGGKLKASKPFSTSNPQLPFICPTTGAANQSLNSLNSSYIWREATPNNFNLYSSSIPSINSYRYSAAQPPPQAQQQPPKQHHHNNSNVQREPRSHSEDRGKTELRGTHKNPSPAPTPTLLQQVCKYKTASNYDNLYITSCNTPLLSRKSLAQQMLQQRHSNASSARTNYQNYPFPPGAACTVSGAMGGGPFVYSGYGQAANYIPQLLMQQQQASSVSDSAAAGASRSVGGSPRAFPHSYNPPTKPQQAFLYDRRVNRSFDSPQDFARGSKVGPLRRSTPQLVVSTENDEEMEERLYNHHKYHHHYYQHHPQQQQGQVGDQDVMDSGRNSANVDSWCCGNMFKHWRKYHNYE